MAITVLASAFGVAADQKLITGNISCSCLAAASSSGRFKQPQWLRGQQKNAEERSSLSETGIRSILYKVELITSSSRNSSYSEPRGRIWVALIGEDEIAALRSLPLETDSQKLRFQTGDVDAFEFLGPELGRLEALWIGPETGKWRFQEARITTFPQESASNTESQNPASRVYIFKGTGEVLGDGGDVPALELKPFTDEFDKQTREQGLKEYAALKNFLLVADAVIVALGAGILRIAGLKQISSGFFVGGAAGFLYLFLLEGVVDQIGRLEGTSFMSSIKEPSSRFAFVLALIFVTVKAFQVDHLSAQELLGGAAGFLAVKAAIFLTTFNDND